MAALVRSLLLGSVELQRATELIQIACCPEAGALVMRSPIIA